MENDPYLLELLKSFNNPFAANPPVPTTGYRGPGSEIAPSRTGADQAAGAASVDGITGGSPSMMTGIPWADVALMAAQLVSGQMAQQEQQSAEARQRAEGMGQDAMAQRMTWARANGWGA